MQVILILLVWVPLSLPGHAKNVTRTYRLLERSDSHTWCGYSSVSDFKAAAERERPTDTVRVTYSSGKMIDLTYQVDSESGDWTVIDKYTPLHNGTLLKRANLLAQPELEIIQEATIRNGNVSPFRVISIRELGKKTGKANVDITKIDYPPIKVITNLSEMPFMSIVSEMRERRLRTLCKKAS